MSRIVLLAILILGCATGVLAKSKDYASPPGYRPELAYSGIYRAERLYQFNPYEETWYADRTLQLWSRLSCGNARVTLASRGEWQGGLSEAGECAGNAEGQRWATGNYLNFLTGGQPADASRQQPE